MSFPESQRIIERLQGQKVRIPDLYSVLSGWRSDINPHEATVATLIDEVLQKYSFSEAMTGKLRKADLPFFVSAWFPYASAAILRDLTYFVGWMFLVDDQLDQLAGPGPEDARAFAALTRDTIAYIEQSLELQAQARPLTSLYPGVESFRETGEALRARYNVEQRHIFMEEARLTMTSYQVENDIRLSKRVPTNEEYWDYRLGSSCIGMVIALIEFANQLCLPNSIMQDPDMKIIRKEANLIHWITNDIVSAKKEIVSESTANYQASEHASDKLVSVTQSGGFVENLVALYSGPDYNGQLGIDTAVEFIRSAVERFKVAETSLVSRFGIGGAETGQKPLSPSDVAVSKDIVVFIEGCKRMCVGNIDWSLRTARYGLESAERDSEGGVLFVL